MKFSLFFGLLLLLSSSLCKADATISIVTDNEPVKILVKDQFVRVLSAQAQSQFTGEVIFDVNTATLTIVDHQNKTVFPLDQQTIQRVGGTINAAVSAVQGQLESLPQERRSQLEGLFRGFGLTVPKPEKPQLTLKESTASSYAGIDCQQHLLMEAERELAMLCISQGNSLEISNADYESLMAAQRFILDAASHAKQIAEQYGQKIPNIGDLKLAGILVHSTQHEDYDPSTKQAMKASFTITGVSNYAVEPITLPSGYTVKSVP